MSCISHPRQRPDQYSDISSGQLFGCSLRALLLLFELQSVECSLWSSVLAMHVRQIGMVNNTAKAFWDPTQRRPVVIQHNHIFLMAAVAPRLGANQYHTASAQ